MTGVQPAPSTLAGFISRVSGYAAAALRYWEPRRLIYNAALAAVVVGHVVAGWPESKDMLTVNVFLGLFFLAVLANVAYCAVYLVDLFVQFSGLHAAWAKGRAVLLLVGIAFGGVITHAFCLSLFEVVPSP